MNLHHIRVGSGEPLVLVHGLGATARIWRPVLDRLAGSREVIAVDMPGFGRSPALEPGTAPSPANLAIALDSFCREIGVARPHVAGNSLGGWVAFEMARRRAAASVAALSPAGLWRRPLGPRPLDIQRVGRWIRPLIGGLLTTRRGRRLALSSTVAHPERIAPGEARALVNDWLDAPAYAAANHEMRRGRVEDLDQIRVPVTIGWGDHDRLVAPPTPDRRPPSTRLIVLEGCGHTPTWDAPERIAGLLLEASDGHRRSGPAPERS